MFQSRTHTCNELRLENAGEQVRIVGWMENVREVGQNFAFVVVRDFYGTTQVVIETEDMMKVVKSLNKESTIAVEGTVRERASKNPKLPTGDIEVVPTKIEVLGRCRYNELPFEINRQPRRRRGAAPEVPLSRPAQPRREEKHHPPLPGGGRAARRHDRARLPRDHDAHPHGLQS